MRSAHSGILTSNLAERIPLDARLYNVSMCFVMGRPPLHGRPMTPTERVRRSRQRATSVETRAVRIRRAFEVAGTDAQALFIKWLRKMKFIE